MYNVRVSAVENLGRSGAHVGVGTIMQTARAEMSRAPATAFALGLVGLSRLMDRTSGRPELIVGLVDGPVAVAHPDLALARIRHVHREPGSACARTESAACAHGTFAAGMLVARRGTKSPAICPDCTLLVSPIFSETIGDTSAPTATCEELAAAVVDCVDGGARVVNMSAAFQLRSPTGERDLASALDHAAVRGVIVVAAAGNHATVGGSLLTRHPAVIPVAASDLHGRPLSLSNFGASIGARGVMAPGQSITSLDADGATRAITGTSAAAPFVTGAIALLWSEFPNARASQMTSAVVRGTRPVCRAIVPRLLNAWEAYLSLHALRT
jgi:subtilisin family serine protease